MTQLTQERINFIGHLHEVFLIRKGYGAYAFISVKDVMALFEQYLDSNESAHIFINKYVKSI